MVSEFEKYGLYPKDCPPFPSVCPESLGNDPTFAVASFLVVAGAILLIIGAYKYYAW